MLIQIYVVVLGLIFGSFATVLAERIPVGTSIIRPSSKCPNCSVAIKFYDKIPIISFIFLHGKCRKCGNNISFLYPAVEFGTSFLFLVSFKISGLSIYTISLFYLAILTFPLILIDFRHKKLPNILTYSGYLIGISLAILDSEISGDWQLAQQAFTFSTLSATFFLILNIISNGGMGMGDVKLAAMISALLYTITWQEIILGFFIAFLIGAIFGLYLMAIRKINRKTAIPFGPFILTGFWLVLILQTIIGLKFSLL